MAEIELFVFLLFAVAVLAGLGLRSGVPYPVALVLGGLIIGLVPGLPSPELDPDVVFFVFLPPLLYAAAITVSAHELKANWAPITLLAVGLVLVTIAAVAAVANAVLGIPWAAAFVLGAVLGPTDPVSAAAVLDRLGATGRSKTILQGESLINDGTGLTAYKIALAAVGASAGSAVDVSVRVRQGRRGRDRDRARRRLGLRAPAADRHRPVAGRDAVGGHAVHRLRARRGGARLGRAGGRRRRPLHGLALARRDRARDAAAHARVLGVGRVPARRAAVPADRRPGADDHRAHRGRQRVHARRLRAADHRRRLRHALPVDARRAGRAAVEDRRARSGS